jgi:uncharacterized protein YidB (DUF937 family)
MGLFDELGKAVGGAMGGAGGAGKGGGQAALLQAVAGLLGGGGLDGLVKSFQAKGLGDIVGSWVSTGPNLPVSPDQVALALGPDTLGKLAGQVGLDPKAVAGQLSGLLPGLVDKLTPGGALPDATSLQGTLQGMLGGNLGDTLKKLF